MVLHELAAFYCILEFKLSLVVMETRADLS